MTSSLHEQVPEALRLADEWRRETQREVDRRNSAYDHYGMGSTPETLDPLGAKMAAELRRQHAENEALRAGYNAARLEIESLKTQIIPGVQWQCGRLVSGFTATHPAAVTLADSQPAETQQPDTSAAMPVLAALVSELRKHRFCGDCYPESGWTGVNNALAQYAAWKRASHGQAPAQAAHSSAVQTANCTYPTCQIASGCGGVCGRQLAQAAPAAVDHDGSKLYTAPQPSPASQVDAARHFFDAGWKACANFCDRDDVRFDGIVGHRGCPQFEEAFRAARKQGGV